MAVVNLDVVERALETNETIKVYHDLEKPTMYKPVGNRVIVTKNGTTIAIVEKSSRLLFLGGCAVEYASVKDRVENALKFEVELTENARFYVNFNTSVFSNKPTYSVSTSLDSSSYVDLIRITKDPLLSALLVSTFQLFYVTPAGFRVLKDDPVNLLKLTIVSVSTHYTFFRCVDALKIAQTPLRDIVKIVRRAVELQVPFHSQVPICATINGYEFYSNDGVYVILKKNKRGKIVDVQSNACGDYATFCEETRAKFEEIINSI